MSRISERELNLEQYLHEYIYSENDLRQRIEWAGQVQRYHWAAATIGALDPAERILDLGAGRGFGTDILARTGAAVVGIDYHSEITIYARQKFPNPRIGFLCGDATRLPFPDATFWAVCSFEVIEHLPEAVIDSYLSEVRRVLKPGGTFCISTPNRRFREVEGGEMYAFHEREYTQEELTALLQPYFGTVSMHGQRYLRAMMGAAEQTLSFGVVSQLKRRIPTPIKSFLASLLALDRDVVSNWVIRSDRIDESFGLIAVCS
jgi:SAM-dependent methyltransferase